jgi:hypothetical protein
MFWRAFGLVRERPSVADTSPFNAARNSPMEPKYDMRMLSYIRSVPLDSTPDDELSVNRGATTGPEGT